MRPEKVLDYVDRKNVLMAPDTFFSFFLKI